MPDRLAHHLGRKRRARAGELHGQIGAEREQRAVRQIDLLHQPDDQHEAKRDQRKQQTERQAVEDMRKKIEQAGALLFLWERARRKAEPVKNPARSCGAYHASAAGIRSTGQLYESTDGTCS